jgi:hypothetical protein
MSRTKKGTVPLPPRQCPQRCPICDLEFMKSSQMRPPLNYKDVRCLGGRGHEGLHQCQKHAWGTLRQRGIDLENVSGRTGRYVAPYHQIQPEQRGPTHLHRYPNGGL